MNPAHERRKPELLAPAGGPDALRAAVNNGADAVYLGMGDLNARRGAQNFDLDSLAEACDFAHVRGARVYLTANVLVLPDEMQGALEMVDAAWTAGVDAVIVQDLGLIRCLRDVLSHVRVHASTQINTHNTPTALELARMGISRITLARETSVDEVAAIVRGSALEVETFVHGALCFCYSGQCLMSSLIGGRSGNRGLCAQPCRLAYELLDEGGIAVEVPGQYLLSPRDLCGIDMLPQLIEAGVAALKIEGRMKEPEYVATVTGIYRAALDRAIAHPDSFQVTETEHATLAEAFNRGFSQAYLAGLRDNSMMSYTRPNNRGVLLGRVVQADDGMLTVQLDAALDADDIIEFWTGRGRFAQRAGEMRLKGARVVHAPAGAKVELRAEKPVRVGDRVFRISNASLLSAARRTFAREASDGVVPLAAHVRAVTGEPLLVRVTDGTHFGEARGETVEKARTKSVTAEEIIEHVGRLGGTAYRIDSWDIALEPGAGIGFSQLHRVRREALQSYEAAALGPWRERERVRPVAKPPAPSPRSRVATPEIVVWCDDPALASACIDAGAVRAIVPAWALSTSGDPGRSDARIAVELPRIAHDREIDGYLAQAHLAGHAVVGNLGLVRPLAESGIAVEAQWGLNAVNAWTVDALRDAGAAFVWLSPELSEEQTARVVSESTVPVGMAVYGRQEIMVTEHCVLMAAGECSRTCPTCPRRRSAWELRDAKGYRFPVMTDPTGRSHVFNSVPLDLSHVLPQVVATGVAAVRLDITTETPDAARAVVQRFARLIAGEDSGSSVRRNSTSTSGHFFRGVR